eukprot:TRINITY_DN439_c0_g1_i1.p1 TRINITY_DN439_c0_g1~~TRINITY_DN439_c0_g1_i1.p1  ORF type:complete len:2206 (-),score=883.54 TRINITY_DN439_c0_g1_i1:214-6831(-)
MRCALLIALLVVAAVAVPSAATDSLYVVSITPSADSVNHQESESVKLRGSDAITVTFNRPVIPLGSDYADGELPAELVPFTLEGSAVPGRVRWVTTYMARFDADVPWPAEVRLRLQVKHDLVSHDGLHVDCSASPCDASFHSAPLAMSVGRVSSAVADELTDGRWAANIAPYGSDPHSAEVVWEWPHDAVVQVNFNSPVSLRLIEQSMVLRDREDHSALFPLRFEWCDEELHVPEHARRCVALSQSKASAVHLAVDQRAELLLPQRVQFHEYSSESSLDLLAQVSGIYSFRFPFTLPEDNYARFYRFQLWLRHGLDAHSSLEDVRECISITPELPLTVRQREAAVLELEAPFAPATSYRIAVKSCPSVLDGFGLPLLECDVTVRTSAWPTFVAGASFGDVTSLERSDAVAELTTFARVAGGADAPPRGMADVHVSAVQPDRVRELIVALNQRQDQATPWEGAVTAAVDRSLEVSEATLQEVGVDVSALHDVSSLLLLQQYESYYGGRFQLSSRALSFTSLSVVFIVDSSGSPAKAWVTNTATGEAVVGAQVTVFACPWNPSLHDVRSVAHGITSNLGVAELELEPTYDRMYAVVQARDETLFVDAVPRMYTAAAQPLKAAMTLDRGIYKPGDRVLVKGYVRASDAPGDIPPQRDFSLTVVWNNAHGQVSDEVAIDSEFGAFSSELTVPADASYGMHYLTLHDASSGRSCGAVGALVADPRPPTVKLNETALGPVYVPGAGVSLELATRTYVGTPVPNADVSLQWRLQRGASASGRGHRNPSGMVFGCGWTSPEAVAPPSHLALADESRALSNAAGEMTRTTAEGGVLDFVFSLEDEEAAPVEGDTITVDAEWVGPTGELTQDSVTLTVAPTELRLGVQPSVEQPLPGFQFGVYLSLEKVSGEQVIGRPVSVALYAWDGATPIVPDGDSGKLVAAGGLPIDDVFEEIAVCTGAVSDGGVSSMCSLVMPSTGAYVVVAEALLESGQTVATTYPVGKTEAEWEERPLDGLGNSLQLHTDQPTYAVGDSATLRFYSPFPRATALVIIGNAHGKKTWMRQVLGGEAELSVDVDKEHCTGGCHVLVCMAAPRAQSLELPVDVPLSPLFDPFAPMTVVAEAAIAVRDEARALPPLSLSLAESVVAPERETVDLTVSVSAPVSEDGYNELELCVFVVDQAWLDMRPAPTPDLPAVFSTDLLDYLSTSTVANTFALNSGYEQARDIFRRRMQRNQWVTPEDWPVRPRYWGGSSLDMTDEAYFATLTTRITPIPYTSRPNYYLDEEEDFELAGGGGMIDELLPEAAAADDGNKAGRPPSPAPLPSAAGGDARIGSASDSAATPDISGSNAVRHQTSPTAFHAVAERVELSAQLSAVISLPVPANVGSYAVRVFAVSKHSSFAFAHTEMTVRKPVNLNADMPRIGRVGDRVMVGATVTVADPQFHGAVVVRMRSDCSRVAFLEEPEKSFEVQPHSDGAAPVEVQFAALLKELGTGEVEVEAVQLVDGRERVLDAIGTGVEVLPPQQEVFVSTSMALRAAGDRREWDEGIAMPPALPGTGLLSLEAAVGFLPSVVSYARTLDHYRPYMSALDVVCSLVPRVALHPYPGEMPVRAQAEQRFEHSLHLLKGLTDASYGLQWLLPVRSPSYAPWLDAVALHVANRARAALGSSAVPAALSSVWASALEQGVYARVDADPNHNFVDFELLADTYLALGVEWTPQRHSSLLSLSRLLEHVDELSMAGKAKVALAHVYAPHHTHDQVVGNIAELLLSSIRTQGRTAYITYGSGSAHADVDASALALELFARTGRDEQQVDKLAAFVSQQSAEQEERGRGWGVLQYAYGSFALSAFDEATSNAKPDVTLDVMADNDRVMHAVFRSASSTANSSVPMDVLAAESADELRFFVEGSGDVSVVAGMFFVPAELPRQGVARGLTVEKVMQRLDLSTGKAGGRTVEALERGEHVRVTIQITNADDLRNVLLWDPLPACVDAIDENVFAVRPSTSDTAAVGGRPSFGGAPRPSFYSWRSGFAQKEFRKEGVQAMASWLPAGTHTVSYTAVVSARGVCVVPPAEAWVLKQPEVMGRSGVSGLDTSEGVSAVLHAGEWSEYAGGDVCLESVPPLSALIEHSYSLPPISVVPHAASGSAAHEHSQATAGTSESVEWLQYVLPVGLFLVGSVVVLCVGVLVFFFLHRAYRRRSDSYATTGNGSSMMDLDDDDFL